MQSPIVLTRSLLSCSTQAEFATALVAPPTAYDLAPRYLADAYRSESKAVMEGIQEIRNPGYDRIAKRDVRKDVLVAIELAAPIGLGMVRTAALIGAAGLVFSNPITLVLGGAALFFTGKKLWTDTHRALVTDPKIRAKVEAAHAAAESGNLAEADRLFKQVLDIDPDPENKRNPDIHLHRGLLHMKLREPRRALLDFTRASVLMKEGDRLVQTAPDGRKVSISKRGMADMLAAACLDSFASCDMGAGGEQEWRRGLDEITGDAKKRFDAFAQAKDAGHLFGAFGVDRESAEANRALAAKVHFLRAKNLCQLAILSAKDKEAMATAVMEGARLIREDRTLTQEERAQALLEQAQYYFSKTVRDPSSREREFRLDRLDLALDLVDEAGKAMAKVDIQKALFVRAEALKYALATLPQAIGQDASSADNRRAIRLRERLESLADEVEDAGEIDGSASYVLWAKDQLFRMHQDQDERRRILDGIKARARESDDPVSLFHAAVRLGFLDPKPIRLGEVARAASVLANRPDPMTSAFGAKYKTEIETNPLPSDFAEIGRKLQSAAAAIKLAKQVVPFMVQGHAILHDWREAALVCAMLATIYHLKARNPADAATALDEAMSLAGAKVGHENQEKLEALRVLVEASRGDATAKKTISDDWAPSRGSSPLHVWARRTWEAIEAVPSASADQS